MQRCPIRITTSQFSLVLNRVSVVVCLVCVALANAFNVVSAHAERPTRVRVGKEVVVSYGATRRSLPFGREVMSRLRLPAGLKLRSLLADRTVGVIGIESRSSSPRSLTTELTQAEVDGVCARIARVNKGIPLRCEANTIYSTRATPNDPQFSVQYAHTHINSEGAWNLTTGAASVLVAVVDTGVNYNHPDLSANIRVNGGEVPSNGVDDDSNGYVDDYFGYDFSDIDGDPADANGHGTHCAGIIGAAGNNSAGVAGINWSVGILPVRVLDAAGSGTNADVAAGIRYAVGRGVAAISLSLGGELGSATIDDAIAAAKAARILVAAAAGNDSSNNDVYPVYPASSEHENVISVAATNSSDRLATFSNYGAASVDVAAPGQEILSAWLGSSYQYKDGTSMATPLVAGLAALMKSVNPSLGYYELKGILMGTVDPVSSLSGKVLSQGRINAFSAVSMAMTAGPYPTPNPGIAAGESGGVYTLTLRSKKSGSKLLLYGKAKDANGLPLDGLRVRLRCTASKTRATSSDDDGFYGFKIARPSRATSCTVSDSFGNRSRKLKVR